VRRRARAPLALAIAALCLSASAAQADTLPSVSAVPASEIGVTTVRLSGEVNPNGSSGDGAATWRFDTRPQGSEEWNWAGEGTIEAPASEEANPVSVATVAGFGGLAPGQAYEFRLVAGNGAGEAATAPQSFTMQEATAPALATEAATAIGHTLATLHGSVDPEGGNVNPIGDEALPIEWQLQYSAENEAGEPEGWSWAGGGTIEGADAKGTDPIAIEAETSPGALQAGEKYLVRVFAYYAIPAYREASSPEPFGSFTTTPGAKPTPTAPIVSEVDADSAHFEAALQTNSPKAASELEGGSREEEDIKAAFAGSWHFEYSGDDGASWSSAGGGTAPADLGSVEVKADAELEPSRTYLVKLVASNASGTEESAAQEFTTDAVPIEFKDSPTLNPTQTTATVVQEVNPHNVALTGCHFAYGIGAPAGQQAPCLSIPQGNGFTSVSAELTGLTPGADYHFKVVVASAGGDAEGAEQTFPTFPEPGPEPVCPNQAIREAQDAHLPDCRAYEMVTPLATGGADAPAGNDFSVKASANGDRVSYYSHGNFADTVGSGNTGFTQYLARRGPEGWATSSITPGTSPHILQAFAGGARPEYFSEDLSTAIFMAYDLPATTDDIPESINLYSEDTATRALRTITKPLDPETPNQVLFVDTPMAASRDASHLAFSTGKLSGPRFGFGTPFIEEAEAGVDNAYEWDNGNLRLAGILPNGEIPSGGSRIPEGSTTSELFKSSISGDGSRIVFFSPASEEQSQLYLRRDHTDTVWVSEPESAPPTSDPANLSLQWVSPNGKHILFSTDSPLIDEDKNGGADLYRYSDGPQPTAESNLTMITKDGHFRTGLFGDSSVVGASGDSSRIYLHRASTKLYLWEDARLQLITQIAFIGQPHEGLGAQASNPGHARVSVNGDKLAFVSSREGQKRMVLYDANADTITMIASGVNFEPGASGSYPRPNIRGARPEFLSANGRRLFIPTTENLVAEDTNGVSDVYLYDTITGETSLLSRGDDEDGTWFQDASQSGDDVFLVTRAHYLNADPEKLVDIYDARVNGGFPDPPISDAPCVADGCRGQATSPPGEITPSTPRFEGPRNPKCRQRVHRCHHKKTARHKKHRGKRNHRGRPASVVGGGAR
jgi:hypothetical protein